VRGCGMGAWRGNAHVCSPAPSNVAGQGAMVRLTSLLFASNVRLENCTNDFAAWASILSASGASEGLPSHFRMLIQRCSRLALSIASVAQDGIRMDPRYQAICAYDSRLHTFQMLTQPQLHNLRPLFIPRLTYPSQTHQ
jgi:hypothetical protein